MFEKHSTTQPPRSVAEYLKEESDELCSQLSKRLLQAVLESNAQFFEYNDVQTSIRLHRKTTPYRDIVGRFVPMSDQGLTIRLETALEELIQHPVRKLYIELYLSEIDMHSSDPEKKILMELTTELTRSPLQATIETVGLAEKSLEQGVFNITTNLPHSYRFVSNARSTTTTQSYPHRREAIRRLALAAKRFEPAALKINSLFHPRNTFIIRVSEERKNQAH